MRMLIGVLSAFLLVAVFLGATPASEGQEGKNPPKSGKSQTSTPFLKCADGGIGADLLNTPEDGVKVAHVNCGESLTIVSSRADGWYLVRTGNGAQGYLSHWLVANVPPQASSLYPPPGKFRAIAWRAFPWITTSHYQQPGTAATDCTGQGQWLGDMYRTDLSCTATYTPSQDVPITWYHYTIYNLVETSDSYVVLSCTRNWRWSKCIPFVPGDVILYRYKKGQLLSGRTSIRGGNYEIVLSRPKKN